MSQGKQFEPTEDDRERVSLLKADGWSNERIAKQLGIARNTLEKVFTEELATGGDKVRSQVLAAMMEAAKRGSATAGRMLIERFAAAEAGTPIMSGKIGKKAEKQAAAERVEGKFAPPPPPIQDGKVH